MVDNIEKETTGPPYCYNLKAFMQQLLNNTKKLVVNRNPGKDLIDDWLTLVRVFQVNHPGQETTLQGHEGPLIHRIET